MIRIEELLKYAYTKWKDRDYIYEKKYGLYQCITFGEFVERVFLLAKYLLQQNLYGKRICLYAPNSTNWMITDIAVMSYVGESVTISKEWKYDDVDYCMELLECSCLIYSSCKQEIVERIKKKYPNILYICMDDEYGSIFDAKCMSTKDDILSLKARDIDICSKIIFTSGTSAMPKAVMLSWINIFSGVNSLRRRVRFDEDDVCYLFLPLTHTYGNIYNFIYSLISGYQIYLASSVQNIATELLEVNPTIFCSVPLIYINMYDARKSSLLVAFGSRIKYLFCGGASWDSNIRKYYKDVGLNLMEAYALSETASSFAIEYPHALDYESVGTIFEDIDVKIIEPYENGHGEIAVKGDNVFLGYAENEVETKKAFTEDGFFLTGDIGYIDDERRLYITGRKKKILLGSNGENISIEKIISKIKSSSDNIRDIKIYQKENKLCSLIYVTDINDLNIENIIEEYNAASPSYEKIEDYQVLLDSVDVRLKQ